MLRALNRFVFVARPLAALALAGTLMLAWPSRAPALRAGDEPPPPGELEVHSSSNPVEEYLVADCDGDGWDEILTYNVVQPGFTDVLIRWHYDGSRFCQAEQWTMPAGRIHTCLVTDLEGDGVADIVASCIEGRQGWLDIYAAGSSGPARSTERMDLLDKNGDGTWDGNFRVGAFGDVDDDGVKDIFLTYGAGYDSLPRGVAVLSGSDLSELGFFQTAGPPERVEIYEGGSSGDMVILVSTESVSNGHRVGDFNDVAMYLIALNSDLEILWHVEATEKSARWDYEVADLEGDGEPEVVMSRRWKRGSEATGHRLEARYIRTGEVKKFRQLVTDVDALLVTDLDRDTSPEVVMAQVDGTLQVLDAALEPVYECEEDPVLYLFFAEDIDQDGNTEIVGRGTSTMARIFDERLNLLASRDFGSLIRRMELALVGPREPFLLISLAVERDLRFMKLRNARRTPEGLLETGYGRFSHLGWSLIWLVPVLAFAAGLGVALLVARRRANGGHRLDAPSRERAVRAELVVAIASFGHSGASRSNLERLAQYCELPPDPDDAKYPEYQRRLSEIIEGYSEFTRVKLEQISVICRRLDDCKESGVVLAHHLKQLNSLIRPGNGEAPGPVRCGREESSAISAHARALLNEVNSVARKVLASYSIDVGAAVCRVLPVIKEQIGRYGVDRVSLSIEDGGLARIDRDALKTCLEILMVNGAEAMAESAERSLAVTVTGDQGFVDIGVRDSGSGIDKRDLEKLFERGFTTKGEGRGEGLYLAREIAQRYGGRIFVESSSPEGTLIVLRLKRVSE